MEFHVDILAALEPIGSNRENLRLLVDQLRRPQRVVPYVGAGLSIPFGFPGWTDFLLSQAREGRIEQKIRGRIRLGQYEEAAEDLFGALGQRAFHDAIRRVFGDRQLEGKCLEGAVARLPGLAAGPVVTTNFDRVLERVFRDADRPFEDVVWGASADVFTDALQEDRAALLKIHGDWKERTGRVLTREEYKLQYGPGGRLSGLVGFLLSRRLLFLGCSLNGDRILGLLHDKLVENPAITHYAVVERPSNENQFRQRGRYLSDLGIRPVWYPPGRHDLIESLLAYLAQEAPPAGSTPAEPDLSAYQRDMERSDGLGWIGVGPSLQIKAATRPVSELLLIPTTTLNGSYVLGDPFVAWVFARTYNPGVWALMMGMMVNSQLPQLEQMGLIEDVERGRVFTDRMRHFIHTHSAEVLFQVSKAPENIDSAPRHALMHALNEVLAGRPLPAYDFSTWNSIPMYIERHPLLAQGKVARFVKKARPIGNQKKPTAFEVTFEPENADETANGLVRAILQVVGRSDR